MSLKSLSFLIENEMVAKILSSEGNSGVRGQLSVKYFPTDDAGTGEPDEDSLPESPEDLCNIHLLNSYDYSGQEYYI